jgi:hypothetical protein
MNNKRKMKKKIKIKQVLCGKKKNQVIFVIDLLEFCV